MSSDYEIELVFAEFKDGLWSWKCDCGAQNVCDMEPLEVFDCKSCGEGFLVKPRQ